MSEIKSEIRDITPEEAIDLLSKNTRNRRIQRTLVARLANEMVSGRWQFDGSPIRIAEDGRLLDGQHRLNALVESETTQKFLIVSGVKDDAQAIMDTGRKRTFADMLSMNGETNATGLAALVSAAFKYEQGARGSQIFHGSGGTIAAAAVSSPSIPVLMEFLRDHEELREAMKGSGSLASTLSAPPSLINFTKWRLQGIDYDDAEHFFSRLGDGAGLAAGSPILALRNRLMEMYREGREKGHRPSYELGIALIFKAWNLYRDGREITRLYFKPGGATPEQFPEPR